MVLLLHHIAKKSLDEYYKRRDNAVICASQVTIWGLCLRKKLLKTVYVSDAILSIL